MWATPSEQKIVQEFHARHPEYKQCTENDELILQYLENYDLQFTLDSLERAFEECSHNLTIEYTPQQIEAENQRQEAVAFRFLSTKPSLAICQENALVLTGYLQGSDLPFTVENLETAYEACLSELIFEQPKVYVAPVPTPAFPWGDKLTSTAVAKMDRKDFRKWFNDPEFKKQLNAIGIRA